MSIFKSYWDHNLIKDYCSHNLCKWETFLATVFGLVYVIIALILRSAHRQDFLAWTCSVVEILFWHQKLNSWFYVLHKVPSFRKYAYQFWLKLHAICMGTIRIKVLWSLFLSILCTLYVHTQHMTAVWLQTTFIKQGWSHDFSRNQKSFQQNAMAS